MTKEVLDEIIKRRHREGKTLSVRRINNEELTHSQIHERGKKYYGRWTDALKNNGVVPYGNGYFTKEETAEELKRFQEQGSRMRLKDFPPELVKSIQKHYEGYKKAKDELGIVVKGDHPKPTAAIESNTLYTEKILETELRKAVEEYKTLGEVYEHKRRIIYAINKISTLKEFAEKHDIKLPKKKPHKIWTDDMISKNMEEAVGKHRTTTMNQLNKLGYRRLTDAVRKRYGTWNAGLVALGYEMAYEYRDPSDNLTKEETKEKVLNALARGIKPSRGALEKEIKGLARSIKNEFKGIGELKKYCGFCAIDDRPSEKETRARLYRPDLTTVEGIKREITRMWYIGAPMNYAYVREKRRHVLDAVNKRIGSWKKAVESLELDYEDVSATTNVLSECGTAFEVLFAKILTELGYEYIREGEGVSEVVPEFILKPDFILPNWRWIDCKLSEWTDIRETIIRYHSEKPNGITIVYLRGKNQRKERGQKWRYEHVSVYQFTKQLPKDRRVYYEKELRKIEDIANENTVAN